MNTTNTFKIALTFLIIPALTGCYTQVATEENPPEQVIVDNENYEYGDYYYEGEEEELDSEDPSFRMDSGGKYFDPRSEYRVDNL